MHLVKRDDRFDAERIEAVGGDIKPAFKILYLAGFGRNGGTLLDRLLGEVPGFISLGELRFVWLKGIIRNELCNCGRRFRECTFWGEVFEKAFGGMSAEQAGRMVQLSERVDRTRYLPLLMLRRRPRGFGERACLYRSAIARLYKAIALVSGCGVLVDSSKFAGYGWVLGELAEARLYVVHLVRDARASAFSWLKRKRKLEVPDREDFLRRYGLVSSAMQWVYRNIGAELLRYQGERFMRLRYEDLADDPRGAVRRIVDMVGVPDVRLPFTGTHTAMLGESHTQSGNPVRFTRGAITVSRDEAWRREMSQVARMAVTTLTLPLLIRYGYLP